MVRVCVRKNLEHLRYVKKRKEETNTDPPVSEDGTEESTLKGEECEVKQEIDELEEPCLETKTEDVIDSVFLLEKDEISTPRGPDQLILPEASAFPKRLEDWIPPKELLDSAWDKKRCLRTSSDKTTDFKFSEDRETILMEKQWEIPKLVELKRQLNEAKSSLDDFPLDSWHFHTKKLNIGGLIVGYVKKFYNPEFASQAWVKFFEILCSYGVIPDTLQEEVDEIAEDDERKSDEEKVPFDSVHLCEAPGAFVSALNHFLRNTYSHSRAGVSSSPIDWNWMATSLNPYYEGNDMDRMISDDQLILKSMDHWTFLEDATGNILSAKNLNKLIEQQQEKLNKPRIEKGQMSERILLVTADGSIDCQFDPQEQEGIVAHLQFGEILAALKVLSVGGSFVLKIFTFLESTTISHLYLLSCAFKEVNLFKPSCSKEGNSEVYVICLGYLGDAGVSSATLDLLTNYLDSYGDLLKEGRVLLPFNLIPEFFIERVKEAAEFFCDRQMRIIKRNIGSFPSEPKVYHLMKTFRKEAAEQWIKWSEINLLDNKELLFTKVEDAGSETNLIREDYFRLDVMGGETFASRRIQLNGTDVDKLTMIKTDLLKFRKFDYIGNVGFQVLEACPTERESLVFEKHYDNILSSRFCYGRLLSYKQQVKEIAKKYLTEMGAVGISDREALCAGDDLDIVLQDMQANCGVVEQDTVTVICFKKKIWDTITKSDFLHQQEDLRKVVATIKNLKNDSSLFLCKFPMLTRLQTGLIYWLSGLFEKLVMRADSEKNIFGIMLYKFRGATAESKKLFNWIDGVLGSLRNDKSVLQIVPTKTLIEHMPSKFLICYNHELLTRDIEQIASTVADDILKDVSGEGGNTE